MQSKIDSLNILYETANMDSLSYKERHRAIGGFLKGAIQFNIDSLILKGHSRQASIYNKEKKWDSAIQVSRVLLAKAQLVSDSTYIGRAYFKMGLYHKEKKEWIKAFENYNQSFKIHRDLKDSLIVGKRSLAMANLQKRIGDYGASLQTATDGLEFNDRTDDYKTIAGLIHIISVCYKEQQKDSLALVWNQKAIGLTQDSVALEAIGIKKLFEFLNTKANIHIEKKEYDTAIRLLDSLRSEPKIRKDSIKYARVSNNLGYVLWKKDSTDHRVLPLLLEALAIRQKEKKDLISSYIKLASFHAYKNPEQALQYTDLALKSAEKLGNNPESQIEALELAEKIQEPSLESAQRLNSLYRQRNFMQNQLRGIYEPTRYENDKLAESYQNEIMVRKDAEYGENLNGLLAFLAIVCGLFIYFYLKQRSRQKAQLARIQERHQTENRLTKKVHDEVGNDLYYLMIQIQNDPDFLKEKGLKILDGLESIYAKARDISREYSAVDTGENYPDELLSLLNSYGNTQTNIVTNTQKSEFWADIKAQTKEGIFRLVQELLTNMKKHSEATLVGVTFSKKSKALTINYSDNGKGTKTSQPKLHSAENRVEELGGRLTLGSDLRQGFTLKIEIPI